MLPNDFLEEEKRAGVVIQREKTRRRELKRQPFFFFLFCVVCRVARCNGRKAERLTDVIR